MPCHDAPIHGLSPSHRAGKMITQGQFENFGMLFLILEVKICV